LNQFPRERIYLGMGDEWAGAAQQQNR
jgi:hypothetical protein